MMMYGEYEHNMDAKGRIFIPVKLREKLGEKFMVAAVMDRCLSLYSMEDWDALLSKIVENSSMAANRWMVRELAKSAMDVEPDAQGRILLSKKLIAYAGLEKACLIIGAGPRAEIWNPDIYAEDAVDLSGEKMVEQFLELGF